jgi:hypothetical protein
MTRRYVTLSDGRKIGLGAYVRAWKTCKLLDPKTHIGRGIDGYGQTAEEALHDLRAGIDDRINRHDKAYGVGRKWDSEWWWDTWRASRDLRQSRLAIHWIPRDLKERFGHRIAEREI